MMDMMNNGNVAWMMSGMWLMCGLFWLLIIAGAVLLVRWLARRPGQVKTSLDDSPAEILKRRYANGDIDRETFEKMKQDLS
ncbi:MAG: SHOCT domain-containing protein [Polaromonas sp.]|nr:SHOCT domain-containing protein [Polaromonas sp.]